MDDDPLVDDYPLVHGDLLVDDDPLVDDYPLVHVDLLVDSDPLADGGDERSFTLIG